MREAPRGLGAAIPQTPASDAVAEPVQEGAQVSQSEQDAYDQFVTGGMRLLYEPQVMDRVLDSVEAEPIPGIAGALLNIVSRLEKAAQDSGTQIPGDVKLHGAKELLEQIVALAEKSGMPAMSEEDMDSAFLLAVTQYQQMRQERGDLPTEQLSGDLQELIRADREGRLEEMLPGATEYAQKAAQSGAKPDPEADAQEA